MSRPVPAFFEPGTPPPSLPLLTCQAGLSYVPPSAPTVIATEELTIPSARSKEKRSVGPIRTTNRVNSPAPYVRPGSGSRPGTRARPVANANHNVTFADPLAHSLAEYDSDSSELSEPPSRFASEAPSEAPARAASELTPTIPRASSEAPAIGEPATQPSIVSQPQGEVARPGRGGFNFKDAMTAAGWESERILTFQTFVTGLIDQHLDVTKSYQPQNESLRQVVRDLATTEYPELASYENCWPVKCIMISYLKARSAAHRKAVVTRGAALAGPSGSRTGGRSR
ncbi:hypothetical protein BD410DRAFT_846991 [Rickenella mellea]|uniref:Uncharacterized protein n=1 Tax=Rickenella mellea TaxID=50990 RepID=A0A4Y7PEG5_9AGAM|nr:hypothetical protein BD410DRAFT_846991 [Rickenella mellea]